MPARNGRRKIPGWSLTKAGSRIGACGRVASRVRVRHVVVRASASDNARFPIMKTKARGSRVRVYSTRHHGHRARSGPLYENARRRCRCRCRRERATLNRARDSPKDTPRGVRRSESPFPRARGSKVDYQQFQPTADMLSAIVKEHQSKQSARKERQEQKRKDAVQAASNLTQALVDHLNVGSSVPESEETRRRSEAAAAQRDQFCQANAVVVEFGGVLLELLERDRRRGKLGAQHRGRHENDSDRFGIFLQSHARESKCR